MRPPEPWSAHAQLVRWRRTCDPGIIRKSRRSVSAFADGNFTGGVFNSRRWKFDYYVSRKKQFAKRFSLSRLLTDGGLIGGDVSFQCSRHPYKKPPASQPESDEISASAADELLSIQRHPFHLLTISFYRPLCSRVTWPAREKRAPCRRPSVVMGQQTGQLSAEWGQKNEHSNRYGQKEGFYWGLGVLKEGQGERVEAGWWSKGRIKGKESDEKMNLCEEIWTKTWNNV